MWALVGWKMQVLIRVGSSIFLVGGVEALWEMMQGEETSSFRLISLVAMIISPGLTGIASVSWRCVWAWLPWIGRKTFPDLTGTWEGTLVSTWRNPETGKGVPPIPTTIWVRQGIFSTSIKLRTGESPSYSTRCLLEADPAAGRFRFWYSYDNAPKAAYRYRSARHEGVAWLERDIDEGPNHVVGCSYTARKTSGDIDVCRTSTAVEK